MTQFAHCNSTLPPPHPSDTIYIYIYIVKNGRDNIPYLPYKMAVRIKLLYVMVCKWQSSTVAGIWGLFVFIQRCPHKHSSHIYVWLNFVEYPRLCFGQRLYLSVWSYRKNLFSKVSGGRTREHSGNMEKQFRYTWLQHFPLLVNVSQSWCSEKHKFRIKESVDPSRGLYFAW